MNLWPLFEGLLKWGHTFDLGSHKACVFIFSSNIDINDFITRHGNALSWWNNLGSGSNYNVMQDFNHGPTCVIKPIMLLKQFLFRITYNNEFIDS